MTWILNRLFGMMTAALCAHGHAIDAGWISGKRGGKDPAEMTPEAAARNAPAAEVGRIFRNAQRITRMLRRILAPRQPRKCLDSFRP
jgi:hypothetical protein